MGAAWMTFVTEIVVVGTRRLSTSCAGSAAWRVVSVGRLPRVLLAAAVLTVALVAVKAAGGGLAVLAVAAGVLYPSLLIGCGRCRSPRSSRCCSSGRRVALATTRTTDPEMAQ